MKQKYILFEVYESIRSKLINQTNLSIYGSGRAIEGKKII